MARGYIDIYCERTGPEFWSEPINAVTNLAFLISAALLARRILAGDPAVRRDPVPWLFTGLVFVIGLGSGLFHTFAMRWAMLADVIPIALFILLYTYFALSRFVRSGAWIALAAVAAVLAVAMSVPALTGFRGGSYAAALLAMVVIGLFLVVRRRHPAGPALLAAAGVFIVSLALRTADEPLCATIPMGTHYWWHILNAIVLYIVTVAMINHGRRQPARA
jgi:hypothetical protein